MLELVAQSVKQRGSGESRTGAHDLLSEFHLRPFFNLSMKNVDRNYISISTKEVPTGLPGDTSLFSNPAWSLLRPPPIPPPPTEPTERVVERVRRGFRFPPGGVVLSTADKGIDVTRTFLRNVNVPMAPASRPPPASSGPASSTGTGAVAAGGKRRAAAAAAAAEVSGGSDQQQYSGDTSFSYGTESKRQRSAY
ncbi:hypothetical protein PLESTB_000079000 [Pleodorina starrii]|uniref:Uncharacterized protein n=1 Tax=Pleodorina starrii TaxID=330485 RepID=A0A9W6EWR5_9CHLO|nr:hypothetical protein PLESTM_000075500 [Pleodorina starrii]GLC48283.1 hypothetical protein PLESTB_000079000 [Pleodorina starrii]GLC66569.1 hypothetical protein PLESTF_000444900 [Pleodorina starrii]